MKLLGAKGTNKIVLEEIKENCSGTNKNTDGSLFGLSCAYLGNTHCYSYEKKVFLIVPQL